MDHPPFYRPLNKVPPLDRISVPSMTSMARRWLAWHYLATCAITQKMIQMDNVNGPSVDDAAAFFANVFGGDRFVDLVGPFPSVPVESAC